MNPHAAGIKWTRDHGDSAFTVYDEADLVEWRERPYEPDSEKYHGTDKSPGAFGKGITMSKEEVRN